MTPHRIALLAALLVLLASRPALAQSGSTPAALFKAAESGNLVEMRKALGSGIAVDAADPDGWTALMVAASTGKLPAAQLLVKSGADVNAASLKGETPLMAAALSGNIAMVKFLLSEGANKTAATAQGLTAADIAERSKKPEIVKLLRPAGGKAASAPATPSAPAKTAVSTKQLEQKVNTAAAAFQSGNFEEAAKRFQEIVTLDPAHALAWHFLGQSLDKTGKKDEARAAFKKSLELQPTGTLAERNEKMLAQIRRGPPPNLPPEVPAGTREIVLKNLLFVSLPDSKALRCVSQQTGDDWSQDFVREFHAGSSGVMQMATESRTQLKGMQYPPVRFEELATLGGRIILTTSLPNTTHEIEQAEGQLFPLKTGNRYRAHSSRYAYISNNNWNEDCEVLERVDIKALKVPLGTDDAFRVRCKVEWVAATSSVKTNQLVQLSLCSNSLGLCPLHWTGEAGESVPNFAGGFTYTRQFDGKRVTEKQSCERLP